MLQHPIRVVALALATILLLATVSPEARPVLPLPEVLGAEAAQSYDRWRPLAAAGDPAAQFNLGVLYERMATLAEIGVPLGDFPFPVEPDTAGNLLRAYAWYGAAAHSRLLDAVRRRDEVGTRLSDMERLAAMRWVHDWIAVAEAYPGSDEPGRAEVVADAAAATDGVPPLRR